MGIWPALVASAQGHEEGAGSNGAPPDPALGFEQFESVRAHLHGWVDFTQLTTTPTQGNDIWGYVSPAGREYALAGFDTVTAVVDVTDPDLPVIAVELDHADSHWSDHRTYAEHLYVSNQTAGGVQVFDLAQIDSGTITELAPITFGGLDNEHTIALDETSGFLYTAGGNYGVGGTIAFDLTDPANPVYAGEWQDNYVHALQVHTWDSGPDAGMQLAYVSGGTEGFQILDVTDKVNITLLATLDYAPGGYTHQGWLDPDNRLFYLGDEGDEKAGIVPTTTTWVIDVSDRAAPFVASTFTNGNAAIDHNLMFRDGVVYEANYTSGLRLWDAAPDPLAPVEVGWFDTFPADDTTTFSGAWGVHVLPSGTVLVQDINAGLFVIGVEDALLDAPDAFNLTGPPDGAFVSLPRTALAWERPWGAWEQTVIVASDAALTQVVAEGTVAADVTSVPLSGMALSACSTFWWSVTATNGIGDTATSARSFLTGPTGDLDGDGVVGQADAQIFRRLLQKQNLAADFDGDGVVGAADRTIMLANAGPC